MGPKQQLRVASADLICDDSDSGSDSDVDLDRQIRAVCKEAVDSLKGEPGTNPSSHNSGKKRPLDMDEALAVMTGSNKKMPPALPPPSILLPAPGVIPHSSTVGVTIPVSGSTDISGATFPPQGAVNRSLHKTSKSFKWTPEMDNELIKALSIVGVRQWAKAAQMIGRGVSNEQCRLRWTEVLDPDAQKLKQHAWTDEEVEQLREYVRTHRKGEEWENKVDWTETTKLLGRTNTNCQMKWTSLRQSVLKTGPWEPNEDNIVLTRAMEWKDRGLGVGLWIELERELGRSSNNCNHRWKRHLLPKLHEQGNHNYDSLFSVHAQGDGARKLTENQN